MGLCSCLQLQYYTSLCMLLIAFIIFFIHQTKAEEENCDYFKGSWILDNSSSYPLYESTLCPFIERTFSCQNNGRPDHFYQNYRWLPNGCDLPRFNGGIFLEKLRGKSVMFVGDSLSLNQWQSLSCMLYIAMPNAKYNLTRQENFSTLIFKDFEVKVLLDRNLFLVDLVNETEGRILKLDSIEISGELWKGIDMLIFNTWHWWNRRDPGQPWDYIQVGNQSFKDMDRMDAFEIALNTWAQWIDNNIDPTKTMVFFQGISPTHYNGTEWNEPEAKSCIGQKEPIVGSIYPGGLPLALTILKKVLNTIKNPVKLLDITNLSQLRKDGHPSIYGRNGNSVMDCTHWCLPGVPDAWNEILYNLVI